MCNFLSGIVLKNGDVITSEYTDAHDLIIAAAGLKERSIPKEMGWIKVEYTSNNLLNIDTYKLIIDENDTPEWFDADMRENVTAKMHRIAQKCILTEGEIPILLGGKWILGGTVDVKQANYVNIVSICNGGTVQEVFAGGTVQKVFAGGTVQKVRAGGTVQKVWDGGTVQEVWDGGTVINDYSNKKGRM